MHVINKLTTKKDFFMSKQKNKFVQSREALAAKKVDIEFFEKNGLFFPSLYKTVRLSTYSVLFIYEIAILLAASISKYIDDTYFYNDKGKFDCALFIEYWTKKEFDIFCVTILLLLYGVGANVCTRKMISKTLSNKDLNAKLNNALAKLGPDFKNIMKSLSAENPEIAQKLTEGISLTEAEANFVVDSMRKYLKAHPNTALLLFDALVAGNFPADVIERFVMEFVPGTATFNMAQKVSKQKSR